MSNLQVPEFTLAQMRQRDPAAWETVQDQIRVLLDRRPNLVAILIEMLGLEGAHEAVESNLDAGTFKFVAFQEDPDGFGIASYFQPLDTYLVLTEGGAWRHPGDVAMRFRMPEEEDDDGE